MSELSEIKKLMQSHIEKSKERDKKIDDIYFSLVGNNELGVKGIAQKVKEHDKYINVDKKLKWTLTGAFAGGNIGFIVWIKTHLGL